MERLKASYRVALPASVIALLAFLMVGWTGCGGRSVEMPNVVGMTYEKALQELHDAELEVRYVEYVPAPTGVPHHTVLRQKPTSGGEVEKDGAITLTLGVTVPRQYRRWSA